MLLAVLNNDTTMFNKIFEAANQFMWNDGTKSYFIWNWPSGGSGAATDADLDIGLSLVFADKLQEKGCWPAYAKGGVTYKTRAMDVIKTIRNKMTAQDYLLPGDNWGGEALNNLNPSYFATAALKVFNLYQSEVNFTPVINNCYKVLAMMPRYSKGQACNWINSGGGRASRGDMAMSNDAIRVPWRIALDALWFNETRAIEYCKNSRGTLTEYANTGKNYLIAQMAHYDESGNAISSTKGSFSEVAMWTCAMLGSKDQAYAQAGLEANIIRKIIGTTADFFGEVSLQDNVFYYKQSIGMLGFALLTGQFPNILADLNASIVSVKQVTSSKGSLAIRFAGKRMMVSTSLRAPSFLTVYSLSGKTVLRSELSYVNKTGGGDYCVEIPGKGMPPAAYVAMAGSGQELQKTILMVP
jgi:endo-1,4-beta-D-glucanase Y